MSLLLYEHPFASYCWKALVALYEREVEFEPRLVLDEAGRAELAALWPPAAIPVLRDEEAGETVPESTTIVEYLDRFGAAPPLLPADPAAALRARLWDRVFDAQVMTPMQKVVLDNLRPEGAGDAHGVAEAKEALARAYELLEARLEPGAWAAGDPFTLADCSAAPSLFYARVVRPWDPERLTNLSAYFGRLMARPSVARVVEDAREYRHLFPLPWPDGVD
ncbi:MAG TPA: glutathione S-transferase family protein [Solirubrobacterales bacterium]|nr:glutathione S-transferase family protein [Solirubrobacterales bacterium]